MTKKTSKNYHDVATQLRETNRLLELGEITPQEAKAILLQCQKEVKLFEEEQTCDQLLNNIRPLFL